MLHACCGRDIVLQTQTLSSTASVTTADGTSLSTRTSTDRIATIQAGADLLVSAGRDLTIAGASLNASGDIQATAGRDLTVTAVQGSYQIATRATTGATTQGRTSAITQSATTQQTSDLAAGGNVTLVAGTVAAQNADATHGNLALVGANVTAGQTVALQGNSVTIAAAKTSEATDIQAVTKNAFTWATQSDEGLAGGSISAGDRLTVLANGDATKGQGNITVTGATLTASAAVPAGSIAPTSPDGSAATSPAALAMQATGNLTVQAASTNHDETHEAYSKSNGVLATKTSTSSSSSQFTQLEGSTLSGNTISLRAGDPSTTTGDLTIQASTLNAAGQATLVAGRDLNIVAGNETGSTTSASQTSRSASGLANVVGTALNVSSMATIGLPSPVGATLQTHKAGDNSATHTESDAVGSTISVGSLAASAGRDANVQGSTIVADSDISIAAARNLNIVSAQSTTTDTSAASSKTVGNVGTLWQPAVGKAQDSQSSTGASTTQVGSQVASLGGNVTLSAGQTFTQTASSVIAQGDINVAAQKVDIGVAVDTQTGSDKSSFSKTAIGGSVSAPLLSAAQSVASLGENASKVGDSRLQALAALGAGLQVAGAAQTAMSGDMGGIKISISLGHDESSSASTQASSTAVGSQLKAGGNLTVAATGAGQDSSLTATGSDLTAIGKTTLKADGAVTLQASQSVVTQHTTNSSSSESLGIGYAMGGSQEGFTLDASASMAKGHGDGTAVSNTNTHVSGTSVDIASGADTTLKGAVVTGNQVSATVGGNLNVQSVQDTTTYSAKQQSAGASISLCIPPFCYGASTGSASFSDAKISGNFASVTEQSGMKAGDGGFQVAVNGNTTLAGAVISSSQAAIDTGKNSLSTAAIKTTDLHNGDVYSANGVSVSGSVSGNLGDQSSPAAQQKMTDADKHAAAGTSTGLSTSPGIASQSGSQGSTTSSGVSAGALTITSDAAQQALTGQDGATAASALNRGVTTDQDTTHALTQAWNGQQLMTQTQAALQITSTAMPVVAAAIGDYAAKMTRPVEDAQAYTALKASQANGTASPTDLAQIAQMESKGYTLAQAQATLSDPQALADYNNWKDDGIAKIGAHAVLGWLGGGEAGATGAGLSAAATPLIAQAINQSDLPDVVKQAAIVAASAAVGASVGGTSGAATGANQAANNFLRHQQAAAMQKELAACQAKAGGCSDADATTIIAKYRGLSAQNDQAVQNCILAGNPQCVQGLIGDAAKSSEIDAALPLGYADITKQFGQNPVNYYGSIKGQYSLFESDVQQATDVAAFRSANCGGMTTSACDALTQQALDYRMMRVGVVAAVGSLTPVLVNGLRALTVAPNGAPGVRPIDPSVIVGDQDLENVYVNQKQRSIAPDAAADAAATAAMAQARNSAISDLISEHSPKGQAPLSLAAAEAIVEQTQPPGTTIRAAGAGVQGPDLIYKGSVGTEVQVKTAANAAAFERSIKGDLTSAEPSPVIGVQVPVGTNVDQLIGKLKNNFGNYDVTGKSIVVVDTAGKVLIPKQSFPKGK